MLGDCMQTAHPSTKKPALMIKVLPVSVILKKPIFEVEETMKETRCIRDARIRNQGIST